MSKILEVKATIIGSKPSIFRTIRLNGDTNLQIVHEVMQAVFNWGNVHMHYFRGTTGEIIKNEEHTILANTLTSSTPIVYVYDYGDAWTINLELISIIDGKERIRPICTDGKRQSPPEDCGGIIGYDDALDLLAHHNSNALRKYPLIAEWYGEDYDPEFFDINSVNSRLANIVLR
ncbi:MAG TPA: plasmid pRiA4b ORF-3 family protein [Tenuifilaceae bacterium]|nr:plasmid pRiA4b ORF-3 family protein [Tenuifilaceae bacterium]HPI45854.1 plasmid pRiA4b ORF-3 family protein [Tenuifilaceae bacterium]HPN22692.1 plasmid pRiA4b ORF-3 family protein [Tenuifilaceae bacterium]